MPKVVVQPLRRLVLPLGRGDGQAEPAKEGSHTHALGASRLQHRAVLRVVRPHAAYEESEVVEPRERPHAAVHARVAPPLPVARPGRRIRVAQIAHHVAQHLGEDPRRESPAEVERGGGEVLHAGLRLDREGEVVDVRLVHADVVVGVGQVEREHEVVPPREPP